MPRHRTLDGFISAVPQANGIALIPMYTDAVKNARALQIYRDLGFNAVPVDGTRIIRYSGATHCIAMQVPSGR